MRNPVNHSLPIFFVCQSGKRIRLETKPFILYLSRFYAMIYYLIKRIAFSLK